MDRLHALFLFSFSGPLFFMMGGKPNNYTDIILEARPTIQPVHTDWANEGIFSLPSTLALRKFCYERNNTDTNSWKIGS